MYVQLIDILCAQKFSNESTSQPNLGMHTFLEVYLHVFVLHPEGHCSELLDFTFSSTKSL